MDIKVGDRCIASINYSPGGMIPRSVKIVEIGEEFITIETLDQHPEGKKIVSHQIPVEEAERRIVVMERKNVIS